jgi:SNF2 family DNA or RNA helicase
MIQIDIHYNNKTYRAEISINDPGHEIWKYCYNMFRNETFDLIRVSNKEISIPWWVFLFARKNLAFHIRRYDVKLEIDKITLDKIQDAAKHENLYNEALESKTINEDIFYKKLKNEGFIRNLYSYQRDNVLKLIGLPSGATFSVPGAGKTTEALAFFAYKKNENSKLFIVSPINAFAVWEDEINSCFPNNHFKFNRLRGGLDNIKNILSNEPDILITNYEQFPSLETRDAIANYLQINESFMFLDESHHIKKGLVGVIGRSILGVCHLPVSKLILSGTPMPNSSDDLIAQFNFLYPEIIVNEYDVVKKIQPIYVRTTKDDLKLPELKFKKIKIPMSSPQKKLYDIVKNEEILHLDKTIKSNQRMYLRSIGKSIMKLLQIVSNPALLAQDLNFAHPDLLAEIISEGDSPKIDQVCSLTRKYVSEEKKVIIWSGFVKNVELLSTKLSDLGAVYIHGGVEGGSDQEQDTREGKIKRFKEDANCMVFVANPAAGGEGISLHKVCHNAIYLDRSFNLAHYLQSMDRIHRLGLLENQITNIEILISKNSIDETVDERLEYKKEKMFQVLNDKSLNKNPIVYDLEEEGLDNDDIESVIQEIKNGEI